MVPDELRVVYEPDDSSRIIADIIAIHGLTGHGEKTWTTNGKNGSSAMWLRDFLPDEAERHGISVRVMVYNYNANAWLGKNTNHLADRAVGMERQIYSSRLECMSRPLLFVAHSMGGLVAKAFLNHLHDRLSEYIPGYPNGRPEEFQMMERWKQLRRAICGIVFLATPHRGSIFGSIMARLPRVSNAVKDLRLNSDQLESLSSSFEEAYFDRNDDYGAFYTACFYETKPIFMLGNSLIVTKESAEMRQSLLNVGLEADHIEICKFSGPDDPKFRAVAPVIIDFILDAVALNLSQKHPLLVLRDTPEPSIEICAIHDLFQNSLATWKAGTAETRSNKTWLEEFLPRDSLLADCKVMTYGYTLQRSRQNSFSVLASSLLMSLSRVRSSSTAPLLFMCHGVGGLIVISALLESVRTAHGEYSDIADNCAGIVFYGTPIDCLVWRRGGNSPDYFNILTDYFPPAEIDELRKTVRTFFSLVYEERLPRLRPNSLYYLYPGVSNEHGVSTRCCRADRSRTCPCWPSPTSRCRCTRCSRRTPPWPRPRTRTTTATRSCCTGCTRSSPPPLRRSRRPA
ncbi:uncharacterized protein V1510DRAFT_311325 [Dipodascopsis tothii]|uniref:uncharacterized protein n=1 Tax=Dipodascopsis tothii TaxID=44089 RepID=UPI0034CE8C04